VRLKFQIHFDCANFAIGRSSECSYACELPLYTKFSARTVTGMAPPVQYDMPKFTYAI
jgi:hypothetical protein